MSGYQSVKVINGKRWSTNLTFSVFVVFLSVFAFSSCVSNVEGLRSNVPSKADEKIAFYGQKITESDKHYPAYAFLASAQLEKARETGDPAYLAEARKNIEASMKIQPNYDAMKTMAMISNYSHRFADAIEWGNKAAEASPEGLALDSVVTSVLVEAHLGKGEVDKAEALLDQLTTVGKKPDDFYSSSARAMVYKARNKIDDAVKAFEAAGKFAEKQKVKELVVWCHVMAAGCLIDSGRVDESKSYLDLAATLEPDNKALQIHQAEFLAASNRAGEALDIYKSLLITSDDPEIERRAYVLARDLGRIAEAESHFQAAVMGFQKILDSGEIYTLGGLAQVYCDHGTDLTKAKSYAEQNLEYKRDGEAQKSYQCVIAKLQ